MLPCRFAPSLPSKKITSTSRPDASLHDGLQMPRMDRGRRRCGSDSGSPASKRGGEANAPLRPMNSVRSPVHGRLPAGQDRQTPHVEPNSMRHGLRASIAPVSGSTSVTT